VVAGVVAAGSVARWLFSPHRGRGIPVRVTMPASRDASAVALALYRANVIDRPWLFAWIASASGAIDRVPPGRTLALRDDLTPRAVLRALGWGVIRVVVPEGFTRYDIGRRLLDVGMAPSIEAFVARTEAPDVLTRVGLEPPSCEGWLFPDTYDVPANATLDDVIDRMVRNARTHIADLEAHRPDGLARLRAAGLDERALVTLASLVERETGAPDDRARVAAVFWNRLTAPGFAPRKLQSDPTIVYGCRALHPASCANAPVTGRVPITRAMRDDAQNTYNTYAREGLPPGPIANPGARSLIAVLSPAATHDLYFVAMGNGHSAFAATLAEHQANVERYLRAPSRSPASDAAR
jgi:UPF0755 protein